jgi:hypothetical protein
VELPTYTPSPSLRAAEEVDFVDMANTSSVGCCISLLPSAEILVVVEKRIRLTVRLKSIEKLASILYKSVELSSVHDS